ncbi:MAG: tetratricopeptide repeat protein [Deltaproteobacteria bacterium]|nr:tetratricopeptide repeat protein [Deltaproteobacteria bacterium]
MAKIIVKKDLKEQDQFVTFSTKVIQYASTNKRKIYLFSGIFVLILLLSAGGYFYKQSYEKKAQEMYSLAYNSYRTVNGDTDKETYTKAVGLYQELIKKYPRSRAASVASYNLGNIYFKLGEIDKSIDAYNEFLRTSSKNNILTMFAYYGLGYCYEAQKKYDKALDSFSNIGLHNAGTFYLAMNYNNMARIYEEMNKHDKAQEYYEKALKQTTDPVMERLIKRKMSTLSYYK